jgi:hypothetical protein
MHVDGGAMTQVHLPSVDIKKVQGGTAGVAAREKGCT